jgi:hypothetical protein
MGTEVVDVITSNFVRSAVQIALRDIRRYLLGITFTAERVGVSFQRSVTCESFRLRIMTEREPFDLQFSITIS